jgi:UDP-N-acetyl-D-mannosaminuronic acid dehydrogenase
LNIVVIGVGYVGIPCAALLADVPGFHVTGIQRRSARSGWKIECLNNGECPFDGDEPGLDELIHRVAVEKQTFRVTDDYAACEAADVILIDVQTPTDAEQGRHVPHYESLREGEPARPFFLSNRPVVLECPPPIAAHRTMASGRFHIPTSYERGGLNV